MEWNTVQQVVRIALGWFSSALVTKGLLDADTATILVGSLSGLVQVGWWIYWNKKK